MRIAVLADFPVHCIDGFSAAKVPRRHFSTWLPQFSDSFKRDDGIELHWIVLSPLIEREERHERPGQVFHILPTARRLRAATFFLRDRRAIQRKLREIRPAIVHGWGTEDAYGIAALDSDVPTLLSMQGIMSEYARVTKMRPRERFCAWLEKRLLRRAHYISCESHWAIETLRPWAPQARFYRVEYGVDPRFYPVEWQPDPEKPAVIFVGTLTPRKGVADLIEAFGGEELADVDLWICGGGVEERARELKGRATPNVKWLGYLGREETARRMSQAWCLALPTRSDTSPNVVKEARVIGMPVVTTPCGGQSDYIEDGRNGFLVEPGDIARLRESLGRVVGDLGKCRTLGGWKWDEQRKFFRAERTGEAFAAIYRELAQAQHG